MSDADISSGLRFHNKVAIVTGGCSGIGRGCANVLAEQGGKVAVLDIDDKEGNSLSSVSTAGELFFIHCDVRKEENIKNAVEEVVKKYGQIDCLVNNVGAHPGAKAIDELTLDSFRDLLNINLVSNFTASKYALPYLRKTKGCIVNISSISGHSGTELTLSYCATKGAVVSLTKALAIDEAKYGVRVNTISPAGVNTPLLSRAWKAPGTESISQERLDYIGSFHVTSL